MARTFGLLFSGFSVKLIGAGIALYMVNYAWSIIEPTFSAVQAAL